MSADEAQILDLEHEAGNHAPGTLICPACQARDFRAKENALADRLAKKLRDRAASTDSSTAQSILNDMADELFWERK